MSILEGGRFNPLVLLRDPMTPYYGVKLKEKPDLIKILT